MTGIYRMLFCLFFVLSSSVLAQDILVNQVDSHKLFVEALNNSKDLKFQEILLKYDTYISSHPSAIEVKVSRCKFIGSAYYDEYEGYNLKYDETEVCINQLYDLHPNHPSVIVYKLENTYGEERGSLLSSTIEAYNANKPDWNYKQASKLFEIGSNYYVEDNDYRALSYAKKAERFSDSLDLSILVSNIHLRLGNKEKAKESILSALYLDSEAWELNQKGNILIEVGEYPEALKIFDRVKVKDSTLVNNQNLYKISLDANNIEAARRYLVKDTLDEWNHFTNLQRLVAHDIEYSDSETALTSYRRLQEENFYDDFLGIKRLKLFFKSPFSPWSFTDLLHIFFLVLCIVVLFVVPYLWVLPIYVFGKYKEKKGARTKPLLPIDWTLRHFWGITFFYLLTQTLLIFIFYYQDYINTFFEVSFAYYEEDILDADQSIANALIFFSSLLTLFTVAFLNRKRIQYVFNSNIGIIRMIAFGVLFVVGNGIILKILGGFIDLTEVANSIKVLAIKEDIGILMSNYGFTFSVLLIAVVVPFTEEIIFRGIILSSSEKHVGFVVANVIQALLFATVHFNFKLFIFYFAFGLITGYAVKKTNGLLTGIIFHAVNNFFVLLVVYMLSLLSPSLI